MSAVARFNAPIGIEGIMQILPHRSPMLLLDRIESWEPGRHIVASKCVTINEPFFAGHFPERPVMPGVLIVEAMGQAAACLAYMSTPEQENRLGIHLMSLDRVKFRRPVGPGDVLRFEVEATKVRGPIWRFSGRAFVKDSVAAEARYLAAFVEES